jgi:hypothetical protein
MAPETGILLLHKEKFDFYSSAFGRVVEFKFIPEIIRDFDVVNAELLENLIKLFIESNKLPKGELVIVVSDNASFIKDIFPSGPNGVQVNVQEETNKFIDSVPFDEVASITFPMPQGTKVWSTNRGLFDLITSAFGKNGFKVAAVLPGLLFGSVVGSKPLLDIISANEILQKGDLIKSEHNLLMTKTTPQPIKKEEVSSIPEASSSDVGIQEEAPKKTDKKRLAILIGVFGVLIVVLILVYVWSLGQQ